MQSKAALCDIQQDPSQMSGPLWSKQDCWTCRLHKKNAAKVILVRQHVNRNRLLTMVLAENLT